MGHLCTKVGERETRQKSASLPSKVGELASLHLKTWVSKNLGRISKYISKAVLISLEVSFLHAWFVLRFLSLETVYQRVSRSDF